jgi:hypothetical protein
MPLDEDREFALTIDSNREITAVPTVDGATVVLLVMDMHGAACIELTQGELKELIDGLNELRREDADQEG